MPAAGAAGTLGMTGVPEVALARELRMHYACPERTCIERRWHSRWHFAAIAFSINWAAGIEETIIIVSEGMAQIRQAEVLQPSALPCPRQEAASRQRMLTLMLKALRVPLEAGCDCERGVHMIHPPDAAAAEKGGDAD